MEHQPDSPRRVQLSRRKGWRMPPNTVNVARPSKWGNPFTITGDWIVWAAVALGFKADKAGRQRAVVALHRAWLTGEPPPDVPQERFAGAIAFDSGREVSTQDHVRGLGCAFSTLYEAPALPTKPDVSALRGKNLACWCKLHEPCHADVLLEIANA